MHKSTDQVNLSDLFWSEMGVDCYLSVDQVTDTCWLARCLTMVKKG